MTGPRKGSRVHAAETVAALARGGLDAIKAAEALLSAGADTQLNVRCSQARLDAYRAAAKRSGAKSFTHWVLATLDMGVDMDG